jgi:hypothetical protein
MKIEDIKSIINTIEEKYNVEGWVVDDIHIWPLIRITNYALLSSEILKSDNKKKTNEYLDVLTTWFKSLKSILFDFKMQGKLEQTDVLFVGDGVSFTKTNELWYDKFCDPIIDYLKQKNIKYLNFEVGRLLFFPRYNKSIYNQPCLDISIIKSKIFAKKIKNISLDGYNDFLNDEFANKYFKYLPDKIEITKRVQKIKSIESYYLRKICKIKPKVGLIVSYYYDAGMAFNKACKKYGIESIDIQHGVQGPYHLAYCNWIKMPSVGYNLLPDVFWVWSEYEQREIINTNQNSIKHTTRVATNHFLNIWKNNSNSFIIKYDKKFNEINNNDKKKILLTLSPDTDSLMFDTYKALSLIQNEYNIYIRLHPNMLYELDRYKKYFDSINFLNYEIELSSSLPLYAILRNIDLHITAQSSTVIESAEFGVFSIITSEYGAALYESQILSGSAIYSYELNSIINSIRKLIIKNKFINISKSDSYTLEEFCLEYKIN